MTQLSNRDLLTVVSPLYLALSRIIHFSWPLSSNRLLLMLLCKGIAIKRERERERAMQKLLVSSLAGISYRSLKTPRIDAMFEEPSCYGSKAKRASSDNEETGAGSTTWVANLSPLIEMISMCIYMSRITHCTQKLMFAAFFLQLFVQLFPHK